MELSPLYSEFCVETLKQLCAIPSPSGFTNRITEYVRQQIEDMGFPVQINRKQSVIVSLHQGNSPLVFMAHLDTLGAMVRSIKGNGTIRISKIGGYSEGTIDGENCVVHTRSGKEFSGTMQSIHPSVHVYDDVVSLPREEKNIEVILDEKITSKTDVINLGIQVGDIISFDPRTRVTPSGFIKSRHLDDKAGAAILLTFAKWAGDHLSGISRGIKLAFTSYEEVGHGGSSGFSKEEEEMIAVDMGAIGDDLQGKETAVSICAKDSGGPYHYELTSRLLTCAEKENLSYAVDIFPRYGSDVEASLRAGYNVMHGLIGPGVFASHGYERTHIDGLRNTLHLICAYVSEQEKSL